MKVDKLAQARIIELEAELDDAFCVIDLQQEEINELKERIICLKGQLALVRQDHRYEVG
jgi:FtsZ-binding cell division protein ZapB